MCGRRAGGRPEEQRECQRHTRSPVTHTAAAHNTHKGPRRAAPAARCALRCTLALNPNLLTQPSAPPRFANAPRFRVKRRCRETRTAAALPPVPPPHPGMCPAPCFLCACPVYRCCPCLFASSAHLRARAPLPTYMPTTIVHGHAPRPPARAPVRAAKRLRRVSLHPKAGARWKHEAVLRAAWDSPQRAQHAARTVPLLDGVHAAALAPHSPLKLPHYTYTHHKSARSAPQPTHLQGDEGTKRPLARHRPSDAAGHRALLHTHFPLSLRAGATAIATD